MNIHPFFDTATATFTYIVYDLKTRDAIIIDPVLDFELFSATIADTSIELLKNFINAHNLSVKLILDTHVHADHMTGSYYLKKHLKVPSAIGAGFKTAQDYFSNFYGLDVKAYESAYEQLLAHEQTIKAGSIMIKALSVPGHTPSCTAYVIEDNVFSGDTLFQPNLGCGRADFPGGSARNLYHSIKEHLYALPDHFTLWVGHDYPSEGQAPQAKTTILEEKTHNRLINTSTTLEQFIEAREKKDKTLGAPKLLLPSLQVNILGGQLPHADRAGRQFLRIPLKTQLLS